MILFFLIMILNAGTIFGADFDFLVQNAKKAMSGALKKLPQKDGACEASRVLAAGLSKDAQVEDPLKELERLAALTDTVLELRKGQQSGKQDKRGASAADRLRVKLEAKKHGK